MAIKYIKCPDCGGLGFIKDFIGDYHSCPTCHGARFLENDTMDLKELKEELEEKLNERYGNTKCIKCKYWSVRDTINKSGPIIQGTCTKCDKHIIANDPCNEVPDWCPGYEVFGKTLRDGLIYDVEEEKTMDLENVTEEVNEATNVKVDPTNPDHYKNHTSLECIEAMEIVLGDLGVTYFCVGNAWKYIWRWKNKNGIEDLKKAKWYIEKAWELIDGQFIIPRPGLTDLLTRMNDYINKVEGRMKNDKDN